MIETTKQLNILYVQSRTKPISLFLQSCWISCKQICTDRHDVGLKGIRHQSLTESEAIMSQAQAHAAELQKLKTKVSNSVEDFAGWKDG